MRNFKELKIWQLGIEIVENIYAIASKLPENEKYGIRTQITRAAVSVPSNIAEGSSRYRDIEFKRFLEIALGSLFEVETQLIVIQKINLINEDLTYLFVKIEKESKMLNAFISKIKERLKPKPQNPKPNPQN